MKSSSVAIALIASTVFYACLAQQKQPTETDTLPTGGNAGNAGSAGEHESDTAGDANLGGAAGDASLGGAAGEEEAASGAGAGGEAPGACILSESDSAWTAEILGDPDAQDNPTAIALDACGGLLLGGSADGRGYIRKYGPGAHVEWTRAIAFTGPGTSAVTALTSDDQGYFYAGGNVGGALSGATSAGATDIFFGKFGSDGRPLWIQQLGSAEKDSLRSLTLAGDGSLLVIGAGAQLPSERDDPGPADLFELVVSPSGALKSVSRPGADSASTADVATDAAGNVYFITGSELLAAKGQDSISLDFRGVSFPESCLSESPDQLELTSVAVSRDGARVYLTGSGDPTGGFAAVYDTAAETLHIGCLGPGDGLIGSAATADGSQAYLVGGAEIYGFGVRFDALGSYVEWNEVAGPTGYLEEVTLSGKSFAVLGTSNTVNLDGRIIGSTWFAQKGALTP